MKSSTLQPFNAAVVAIACTLLVLELDAPDTSTLASLFDQWEILLAHYNAFCLIYLFWYMHAKEIERVDNVSPIIVILNGFWLLLITFIPFATDWVESYPDKPIPQIVIIITFSLVYIINNWIIDILIKENPDIKFSSRVALRERIPVYILLFIALVNSFIFPIFNIGIILLITIFFLYLLFRNNKKDVRL